MRKICLLSMLLLQLLVAHAQYNLDSLNNLLQKANHDSTRSMVLALISRHFLTRNTDTALKIAQRGMLLAKNINFAKGEADGLGRMGQCYNTMGNDAKSIDCFIQTLKKAESINYNTGILTAYGGLGSVYTNQGEYEKALYYDLRSKELAGEGERKLNSFINIGDDYEKLNKLDSAKYFTNLAFDYATQISNQEGKAITLNNLGNIFRKMNQPDVALANYRLSLALRDIAENEQIIAESTLGMANIFLKMGKEDSALHYAKISFNASRHGNFGQQLLNAGNFLADYYRKKKNVDSAYVYLNHVIESKDSIYSQEKNNQIKNLAFDETLRQQEMELKTIAAGEERKTNIQFAIIAVTLVSFIIIFFLLSQSIIVNEKWVRFLGVLALLLVFEFINMLIHPWLTDITHHSPPLMLLGMVAVAALIIPLHHRMQHWVSHKMVAKNKRLRLEAAKKIVARLEAEEKG